MFRALGRFLRDQPRLPPTHFSKYRPPDPTPEANQPLQPRKHMIAPLTGVPDEEYATRTAFIWKPSPSVTQTGRAKYGEWLVDFSEKDVDWAHPLTVRAARRVWGRSAKDPVFADHWCC